MAWYEPVGGGEPSEWHESQHGQMVRADGSQTCDGDWFRARFVSYNPQPVVEGLGLEPEPDTANTAAPIVEMVVEQPPVKKPAKKAATKKG